MKKIAEILPAALLVAVQFLLASGLEILHGNRMEFEFGIGSVLVPLVALALGLTALLCLLGAVLPESTRSRYRAFLFALGVLGWLQASFLSGGYGQFTGESIDWSAFRVRGWLDLLLWIGVLTLAIRYHSEIAPRIRFAAPLLTALILLGLGGRALFSPAEAPPTRDEIDTAAMARYSRNQNVIHILLDGFQTGTFRELVEDGELSNEFDGFTLFQENTAVAAYTAMSVPAIFSGYVFDGTETPSEYHHRALRKGGFHHQLYAAGYSVHLIPKIPMHGEGYTRYAGTPHHYGLDRPARIRTQTRTLLDLGLFRSSPHFLRRFIHNDGNWRWGRTGGDEIKGLNTYQRDFFADYIDKMKVDLDEPVYSFIHLLPPHGPFVTLPDGTYAGKNLPETHENYLIEARFTLDLFLKFLDRLREEGVYDSTLIVLHADHGLGAQGKRTGDTRKLVVPRAPALLAVKPADSHGSLIISDAQTTVADIPATILGLLGLDHDHPGRSAFDIPADETRARPFNSYSLGGKNRGIIERFQLKGSVYDPAAWHSLNRKPVNLGKPVYVWGTPVEFGVGNESDRYLGSNWSSGGAGGCRMNMQRTGKISLQPESTRGEVLAKFTFRPRLREGEQRELGLRLICNGKLVGEQIFSRPQIEEFEFVLPAGMAASGRLQLEFQFVNHGGGKRGVINAFCLVAMQLEAVTDE